MVGATLWQLESQCLDFVKMAKSLNLMNAESLPSPLFMFMFKKVLGLPLRLGCIVSFISKGVLFLDLIHGHLDSMQSWPRT